MTVLSSKNFLDRALVERKRQSKHLVDRLNPQPAPIHQPILRHRNPDFANVG